MFILTSKYRMNFDYGQKGNYWRVLKDLFELTIERDLYFAQKKFSEVKK